ncbi:uncharacterized protein [Clytia hemisphaerica]|uniref:uncharacterized protein isoform X2 n=1 Tax=Clytia hemisphaerica TaxID=252671 RepID=UPI0034D69459
MAAINKLNLDNNKTKEELFEAIWFNQIYPTIKPKILGKVYAQRRKKLGNIKIKQLVTLTLEVDKLDLTKDANQKSTDHQISEDNTSATDAEDSIDKENEETKTTEHQISDDNASEIYAEDSSEEIEKTETGTRKRFKFTLKEEAPIDTKVRRIERLKRINGQQADTIEQLKEKNASLTLRNAAFTRLKIIEQLGERRSTLMVDASLFSNTFHAGDAILQQEDSDLLDPSTFEGLEGKMLIPGLFCFAKKVTLSNGESVVLKTHKPESFGLQSLAVLSHEHRLLKFVGSHANLVSTVGLVPTNGIFAHVMKFEYGMSL